MALRFPNRAKLAKLQVRVVHAVTHKVFNADYMAHRGRALYHRWFTSDTELKRLKLKHNGVNFLYPDDLTVETVLPRRVLLVGSCLAEGWDRHIPVPYDLVVVNNLTTLADQPPQPAEAYDLQIVQIPKRAVVRDDLFWSDSYRDAGQYQAHFDEACAKLSMMVEVMMKWAVVHGIPTLVTNFFVPQQNSMGILLPRYDLRNPAYFIEQLNAVLEQEIAKYPGCYVMDFDNIASVYGKKYFLDSVLDADSHGATIGNGNYRRDRERIEFIPRVTDHYDVHAQQLFELGWQHVLTAYRTLRQVDAVKLVIVDLDNTLWRGIVADHPDEIGPSTMEGWPLGFVEALAYLKKRGIVLAIASKNEESRIRELWPQIMQGRLQLEDFSVVKINWQPKAQNIADILQTVNVLPQNTLFIDDNPVERNAVKAAFPEIRVLGKYPYYFKRILLWSSETQVPHISDESARRTQLIQARAERESLRTQMSREEFLASLQVRVQIDVVTSAAHGHIKRIFELLNKTNQFNTTGKRWSDAEFNAFLQRGAVFSFAARDKYSDYGHVGAVLVAEGRIEQFVMSCRVLGLEVETRVLEQIEAALRQEGRSEVVADLTETAANFPCRDLYARHGFVINGVTWRKPLG